MNQVKIKKVKLRGTRSAKRILVSFKFKIWMVYKRPTVRVYATITRPNGKVFKRQSANYWGPWRGGYIGSSFAVSDGTWKVHLDVKARKAEGTEGDFEFEF